jgi:hypothetical protein
MATATRLFTHAKMKNHVQTVELDTLSNTLGSVAIILIISNI